MLNSGVPSNPGSDLSISGSHGVFAVGTELRSACSVYRHLHK